MMGFYPCLNPNQKESLTQTWGEVISFSITWAVENQMIHLRVKVKRDGLDANLHNLQATSALGLEHGMFP